ncbi:MAG TPA: geranylgeranyl reductase family protein [Opitutaceae bacterium]|nr:geranylgeranyl reductase family protein [Opitutaceae bacterium]
MTCTYENNHPRHGNGPLGAAPLAAAARPSAAVFDVAIVGAGPAGGAAALALGGTGLRVLVVEKAVPPRYKTCGGGVLWRAIKLLPLDVRSVVERECRTAELVHHNPSLRFFCRREHPVVCMVMRSRFDHLLLTAAMNAGGVEVRPETTVTDVHPGGDAVCLVTDSGEIHARHVIAADGANSIVARKTGRPELRGVFPAFECEATFSEDAMAPFMEAARFDFGLVPAGYGWVFPKRNHLSVGVGTTRRGAANLPASYRTYVDRLGLGTALTEERHGYMIPCRPRDGLFGVPRILFTGDAAGLADPVTAEGITAGILSGQLAARAILAAGNDPARAGREYRTALQRELLADLRIARRLAWLLYDRPRWAAALLSRHGQGMSELMTRVVTGECTYRDAVRRPGHYLRLLRPGPRQSTASAVETKP